MTPFETLMETDCLMPPRPYHTSIVKEAKPAAALRSEREDWRNLTDEEQHDVAGYLTGEWPLSAVCVRGQVYLRRHVKEGK